MSSLSMHDDHRDAEDQPYELSHETRNWWSDRLRPLWSQKLLSFSWPDSPDSASLPGKGATSSPASIDAELEDAVFAALRDPRDPESLSEPAGFLRELDRRIALISVASRFAAAVGAAAVVALAVVFLIPGSGDGAGQTDGASSGIIQSMKAALNDPDDAKPALCELQTILGAPQTQPAITHAQSETLLQQFMQWREKPTVAKP